MSVGWTTPARPTISISSGPGETSGIGAGGASDTVDDASATAGLPEFAPSGPGEVAGDAAQAVRATSRKAVKRVRARRARVAPRLQRAFGMRLHDGEGARGIPRPRDRAGTRPDHAGPGGSGPGEGRNPRRGQPAEQKYFTSAVGMLSALNASQAAPQRRIPVYWVE